jgi:hypothetical protein
MRVSNEKGTMSNAAWAVPSTFDTFLDVTESLAPLNVSLWHQVRL